MLPKAATQVCGTENGFIVHCALPLAPFCRAHSEYVRGHRRWLPQQPKHQVFVLCFFAAKGAARRPPGLAEQPKTRSAEPGLAAQSQDSQRIAAQTQDARRPRTLAAQTLAAQTQEGAANCRADPGRSQRRGRTRSAEAGLTARSQDSQRRARTRNELQRGPRTRSEGAAWTQESQRLAQHSGLRQQRGGISELWLFSHFSARRAKPTGLAKFGSTNAREQ